MGLVDTIRFKDGDYIRKYIVKHQRTISDDTLNAARDAARFANKEHLLHYIHRY